MFNFPPRALGEPLLSTLSPSQLLWGREESPPRRAEGPKCRGGDVLGTLLNSFVHFYRAPEGAPRGPFRGPGVTKLDKQDVGFLDFFLSPAGSPIAPIVLPPPQTPLQTTPHNLAPLAHFWRGKRPFDWSRGGGGALTQPNTPPQLQTPRYLGGTRLSPQDESGAPFRWAWACGPYPTPGPSLWGPKAPSHECSVAAHECIGGDKPPGQGFEGPPAALGALSWGRECFFSLDPPGDENTGLFLGGSRRGVGLFFAFTAFFPSLTPLPPTKRGRPSALRAAYGVVGGGKGAAGLRTTCEPAAHHFFASWGWFVGAFGPHKNHKKSKRTILGMAKAEKLRGGGVPPVLSFFDKGKPRKETPAREILPRKPKANDFQQKPTPLPPPTPPSGGPPSLGEGRSAAFFNRLRRCKGAEGGLKKGIKEVVSITYEEIGLFPRSFRRIFDRFFKQVFSDVEFFVIQEYRFYRFLFLTTFKCIFILFFFPLFINFIAKNYLVHPLTEYFWNTKQSEIFLNSYQQKQAFFKLKNFEEKLYFESLILTKNGVLVSCEPPTLWGGCLKNPPSSRGLPSPTLIGRFVPPPTGGETRNWLRQSNLGGEATPTPYALGASPQEGLPRLVGGRGVKEVGGPPSPRRRLKKAARIPYALGEMLPQAKEGPPFFLRWPPLTPLWGVVGGGRGGPSPPQISVGAPVFAHPLPPPKGGLKGQAGPRFFFSRGGQKRNGNGGRGVSSERVPSGHPRTAHTQGFKWRAKGPPGPLPHEVRLCSWAGPSAQHEGQTKGRSLHTRIGKIPNDQTELVPLSFSCAIPPKKLHSCAGWALPTHQILDARRAHSIDCSFRPSAIHPKPPNEQKKQFAIVAFFAPAKNATEGLAFFPPRWGGDKPPNKQKNTAPQAKQPILGNGFFFCSTRGCAPGFPPPQEAKKSKKNDSSPSAGVSKGLPPPVTNNRSPLSALWGWPVQQKMLIGGFVPPPTGGDRNPTLRTMATPTPRKQPPPLLWGGGFGIHPKKPIKDSGERGHHLLKAGGKNTQAIGDHFKRINLFIEANVNTVALGRRPDAFPPRIWIFKQFVSRGGGEALFLGGDRHPPKGRPGAAAHPPSRAVPSGVGPSTPQALGEGRIPPKEANEQRLQDKTVELAIYYNSQSINAITNFFADLISFVTLFYLFFALEIQINITKSFLLEVFFGLDDSKKSLLILLITDLLVGYHSSNIWELFFESLLNHYGLPESQTGIFLLVATLPVLLDVLFKYLIFRHLNRSSPATVATYHAMIE